MEVTRINSTQLGRHIGHNISIIGRVLNMDSSSCLLESSDLGHVSIVRKPGGYFPNSKYVEVIGMVNNDLSVREMQLLGIGENFGIYFSFIKIMIFGKVF